MNSVPEELKQMLDKVIGAAARPILEALNNTFVYTKTVILWAGIATVYFYLNERCQNRTTNKGDPVFSNLKLEAQRIKDFNSSHGD